MSIAGPLSSDSTTSVDERNREIDRSKIEWLKTGPDRVFLYVKMPAPYFSSAYPAGMVQPLSGTQITTWLGTPVATHIAVGRSVQIGGFGQGGRKRHISCRIFGTQYHGWYWESAGDYCRLRKAKRQYVQSR